MVDKFWITYQYHPLSQIFPHPFAWKWTLSEFLKTCLFSRWRPGLAGSLFSSNCFQDWWSGSWKETWVLLNFFIFYKKKDFFPDFRVGRGTNNKRVVFFWNKGRKVVPYLFRIKKKNQVLNMEKSKNQTSLLLKQRGSEGKNPTTKKIKQRKSRNGNSMH